MDILVKVREAASKQLLFLPHAIRQMTRRDPMIAAKEVQHVVTTGEVIENYPEDPRGHSCLMLGTGDGGRGLHVVCSPKDEYLAIITAYVPNRSLWSSDLRTRVKK
ncbi:MAG: hypothetical protein A2289_09150 [Deltaproteobacteria bacterium RIFOXYA12_FULL_58_15]|nr:MAG: hypothetical protein A2289_09150 [Deltaproteobacteria bacterium RIFOXYA12_FULL_58_15]OGR14773.1 MAG: hypothetical protein A2341_15565 [Deltaproteobacteria bacterium RIFOXYB12_FULL_58_9]